MTCDIGFATALGDFARLITVSLVEEISIT